MENLLYYPYINIPPGDWAARALLYYDRIGSIIPQRYMYQDFDLYTRQLLDDRLIDPINPLEVLQDPWRTCAQFIAYMQGKTFRLKQRQNNFNRNFTGRLHQDKFPPGGTRIHEDKFDGEVFYQLTQMGLARKGENGWYQVEQTTANELMTFLASVIGGKLDYQPATDRLLVSFRSKAQAKEFQVIEKQNGKRQQILSQLIPFPEEIDFGKLRAFKDQNHRLLKLFKNRVEEIVLDPAIDINSDLFKEKINSLQLQKEELSVKMDENKLGKIVLGSACGIVGAAVALATSDKISATVGAALSLASAVYTALQIEKPENVADQSGLKYLALIDKRLRRPIPFR